MLIMPNNIEGYYQEIGRAGRDGDPAEVLMLYGLDDIRMRRVFIEQEDSGDDRRRREHQRLTTLLGYCEAPSCRRKSLLSYFGEKSDDCGNCDVCLEPEALTDGTTEAELVINLVLATGELFGSRHIIDIIRGSNSEKIVRLNHNKLEGYSNGADKNTGEWQSILRQLVATGFLNMDVSEYGSLKLTELGYAVKSGKEKFHYRKLVFNSKAQKTRKTSAIDVVDLDDFNATLLRELKILRSTLARARRVPAYVVFTDRALQDMALNTPQTIEEFSKIHGVGAKKLKDLAQPFLEVILKMTSSA